MKNKTITVVIPVYNEEQNIAALVSEFPAVRESLPLLDLLFVDDGSDDNTWQKIKQGSTENEWCHGLRLATRNGQSSALLTGIRHSQADITVTMDGDLQNDPADIPELVSALDNHDAACGYRKNRKDTWSKKTGSRIANAVRNLFTDDQIRDTGCSLKAFHRYCVDDLPPLQGVHRFMPAWFRLHQRSIVEVGVNHRARQHGQSKYTNLNRLPQTIRDLAGYCWYRSRYRGVIEPSEKV